MKPITKHSLALALVSSVLLTAGSLSAGEAKTDTLKPVYQSQMAEDNFKNNIHHLATAIKVAEEVNPIVPIPVEQVKPKRPQLDVPLPEEVQQYLWECSNKSNFSYEMLLALANTESKFDYKSISSTDDYGLFQLHQPNTVGWIASEMGLKKYNLLDPKTNIDMTIWLLSYLRDYWRSKWMSEEQVFDMTILSFHHGIEGSKKYIINKRNNEYLKTVKEYKSEFERGG
ncbi:transglycosylase SLT domain-containing protein [Paenibacillus cremeus]|uniref:Transglycosylase SLT domain-containing protein n=1 Tax=Paenibacillus cremeus TaxID=2163881 RepID=A0A559KCQ3_9BACL|nr:transglycosylase SLT domain-containing protein [Paenibacillus cremeus]TVY09883.1 hypothetical protein FPZ49_10955 [Paenibacillus cremeus]